MNNKIIFSVILLVTIISVSIIITDKSVPIVYVYQEDPYYVNELYRAPELKPITGMSEQQYGYGNINFSGDGFDFILLIDGVATNMTNAGETYNVTAVVTLGALPYSGVEIIAEECNGIAPFALIQSEESKLINCAYSSVYTGADGRVSYTNIPTGGAPTYSNFSYTVNFFAVVADEIRATKTLYVINRSPPPAYARGSTTVNKANVEGTNERILTVFDRVSRSRIGNSVAGVNYNFTIYQNGSATGTNVILSSGRPTGLNITVRNATSFIENASVRIEEDSGLLHWATIQYTATSATTNVSNYIVGQATTDANGNVKITMVPTSGFPDVVVEQSIGNYSVILSVLLPDGTSIYTNRFTVDRDLPAPAPEEIVFNKGEVEGFNEKVLVLYDRVTKYIQ